MTLLHLIFFNVGALCMYAMCALSVEPVLTISKSHNQPVVPQIPSQDKVSKDINMVLMIALHQYLVE